MGTLSKRPLREFGIDIKDRIEDFRSNVGGKLDALHDRAVVESHSAGALWFALAGASLIGSVTLKLLGKHQTSMFVGQWVPTFLILGFHSRTKAAGAPHAF
jgi:hypothetical protein